MRRKDFEHLVRLEAIVSNIEEWGWERCISIELIRDFGGGVGEIREMGKGGHRPLFFWVDVVGARQMWITDLPRKSALTTARLNGLIRATRARRAQFIEQGNC